MKFSVTDSFSKCDQIRILLRIWSHLLKKSVIENFIFLCSVVWIYISFLSIHDRDSSHATNYFEEVLIFSWKINWWRLYIIIDIHSYLNLTYFHTSMFQSAIQMFVNIDQYEQLENLPKVSARILGQFYWTLKRCYHGDFEQYVF